MISKLTNQVIDKINSRKCQQMVKLVESFEDTWETFSNDELDEIKMELCQSIIERTNRRKKIEIEKF